MLWSLAWAVVLIAIVRNDNISAWIKYLSIAVICLITFPSDWSCIAVMCPTFLYIHRGKFKKQALDIAIWTLIYAAVFFLFLDKLYAVLQLFTFLTIPILSRYSGERGKKRKGSKWFFYIYYPSHLIVIGIIRIVLHGNISIIF